MKSSSRPRIMWCAIVVLTAAGIVTAFFLNAGQGDDARSVRLTANASPEQSASRTLPLAPAREDFSGLPPRERINAETKRRMEETAAWREKLRNGNQTTLPPEAYPRDVPPHPSAPPP